MAKMVFIADNTMPGLGAADFARRASDSIDSGGALPNQDSRWRRALRGLDRGLLRDIGLDRGAS